jgi:hypothetical protein
VREERGDDNNATKVTAKKIIIGLVAQALNIERSYENLEPQENTIIMNLLTMVFVIITLFMMTTAQR